MHCQGLVAGAGWFFPLGEFGASEFGPCRSLLAIEHLEGRLQRSRLFGLLFRPVDHRSALEPALAALWRTALEPATLTALALSTLWRTALATLRWALESATLAAAVRRSARTTLPAARATWRRSAWAAETGTAAHSRHRVLDDLLNRLALLIAEVECFAILRIEHGHRRVELEHQLVQPLHLPVVEDFAELIHRVGTLGTALKGTALHILRRPALESAALPALSLAALGRALNLKAFDFDRGRSARTAAWAAHRWAKVGDFLDLLGSHIQFLLDRLHLHEHHSRLHSASAHLHAARTALRWAALESTLSGAACRRALETTALGQRVQGEGANEDRGEGKP